MWIKAEKYAEMYQISTRTVLRWARSGRLQSKKVAGTRFILGDSVEPTQLARIEKKLDDVLHEVRKRGSNGSQP